MSDTFTEKFYAQSWAPDPAYSGTLRGPLVATYGEARLWGENTCTHGDESWRAFTIEKVFIGG